MHISPPILLPRSDTESYDSWVIRCMPVDMKRNYPANYLGAWHGGIHIPHTENSTKANPLRAIADGVVVYAKYPSEKKNDEPLNYGGATDNGCVLIRHEILIGEEPVLFVFYSLTMHMKQVRPEILSGVGKPIRREQVIGTSGCVNGQNAFHFQICCSLDMLDVLSGRNHGYLNITTSGREKPLYGRRYYYIPESTPLYAEDVRGKPEKFILNKKEPLYIIDEGGKTITLRKDDDDYEVIGEVAIAVSYITEPSIFVKGFKTYSEWVRVKMQEGIYLIDVSDSMIKSYSDADFPDWAEWRIVDDDPTEDSQCNSDTIKKWQSKPESILTHFICKFPFEWDLSTFDLRYSWLKTQNNALPEPMKEEEYKKFQQHVEALCFYDQLSLEIKEELKGGIWHFEPRTFMIQIQRAERRLIYDTSRRMNDFTTDDMRYGDMTKEQILAQGKSNKVTIFGREFKNNQFDFSKTVDEHFTSMESMGYWTAWGEYTPLIKLMIDKFRKNEGGILRHELLNKAFIEHKTTNECVRKIKGFIDEVIDDAGFRSLSINDLKKITSRIGNEVTLPKFNDYDWFNGLGITIHDTWSTKIYIEYINIDNSDAKNKSYTARLKFQIQDHFGLDVGDVNGKYFENSPWFCSWFILQRYKNYAYKPFINEAVFFKDIYPVNLKMHFPASESYH